MKLQLIGHEDLYAVEQLQLSLFPLDQAQADDQAVSTLHRGKTWLTATTKITYGGRTSAATRRLKASEETVKLRRRLLQQCYYQAALPLLGETPAWGALAGVRPTKITTRHLLSGGTRKTADKLMRDAYYVTAPRREMALDCSESTVAAAGLLDSRDISLYIGIPFCPTRCAYCSFVSRSIGKRTDLMEPYLEALMKELSHTAKILEKSGYHVRTIYMGGGTPTTLSTGQMRRLLLMIREQFDLSRCLEFTVEGGRPDTLDAEKLKTIASCGVDRMSINPQTMEDAVLHACGRKHNAAQIRAAYAQARDAGFRAINMDLIAGLPTDTCEGFCRSLDEVIALAPENITVHTLAIKKGADLYEKRDGLSSAEDVARMVGYSNDALRRSGYRPYYLYRQKYMSGSFENVGWSKNGTDCLYNIYMMEELHTILSLGGGGMNKVNLPDGSLQRFHNPKFPEQYIEKIDDVLAQKDAMFALLGKED
ncbi:MAG: coproporphyrinogen dehydrogenase HemZ [Faecousia sp.]